MPPPAVRGPLTDHDLQLSLYLFYELHYRGVAGAGERWEGDPDLLAFRGRLEASYERALLETVGVPARGPAPEEMDVALRAVEDADDGPSLSRHLERDGTLDQLLEFLVHR